METSTLRFDMPGKGVVVTLYKAASGAWIVNKGVRGSWRRVCEAELFEYARRIFDAEVSKAENEIWYELEGR